MSSAPTTPGKKGFFEQIWADMARARSDSFGSEYNRIVQEIEHNMLDDVVRGTDGRMHRVTSTGTDIRLSEPLPDPPANSLAILYQAANGFYAKTLRGSVVVAPTLSELCVALQATLASEVLTGQPSSGNTTPGAAFR